MFFWLSKVSRIFLDPLFWLWLVVALLVWRLPKRRGFLLVLLPIFLLSTQLCAHLLLSQLEQLTPVEPLRKGPADLVVLTGMLDLDLSEKRPEFNAAADRILEGVRLVREGYARRLILVGGDGSLKQTGASEAKVLEKWLKTGGFDTNKLVILPYSRNTWGNANEVAKLTGTPQDSRLILVTSAFHMYRARGAFFKAGIKTIAHPVDFRAHLLEFGPAWVLPASGALSHSALVISEWVGIVVYKLTGRADFGEQT